MRVLFEGVDFSSRSGPNSFAKKLRDAITGDGWEVRTDGPADVRLAFIQCGPSSLPTALRLDGIYFNTRQDWRRMNEPIQRAYAAADLIIHQTEFDRRLITRYFGDHQRTSVIRNAADPSKTMGTAPLQHSALDRYSQAWACASSWRPHKRLSENIRYFHEHAPETACLVVAGDVSQVIDSLQGVRLDRVLFAGDLDHDTLTSLYRRSTHLLHLAWLDHCPNVVVDARAAGCRIVCASSGGTEEVAGLDAVVVEEDAWDLTPLDLYTPPSLNFSRSRPGRIDHTNDMRDVSQMYRAALMEIAG